MFGLFKVNSFIDSEAEEWIFSTFAWAFRNFGSNIFDNHTILVTPSNRHFPDKITDLEKGVVTVFQRVRTYAGMDGWRCKLTAQEPDADTHIGGTLLIQNAPQNPAGTFSVNRGVDDTVEAVITFNPNLIKNPEAMVATFAHELAHYLAATSKEESPGGEDLHEHATDLLAVFMGFGIFQANSAFNFRQFSEGNIQGWSYQKMGYMTQMELVYALTIFCVLKGIDYAIVRRYLKEPLCKVYKKSLKLILSNPNLEILKSIKNADELTT